MWSRGEEHVRVLAFLGIRNVATMMPSSLLEFSVKVGFGNTLLHVDVQVMPVVPVYYVNLKNIKN